MQELGNAINESLGDSDRIAEVIGEIRRAGYDVFLVLEATIGFNKRDDSDDKETGESKEITKKSGSEPNKSESSYMKLTSQDLKFLKTLKISTKDEFH